MTVYIFTKEQLEELLHKQIKTCANRAKKDKDILESAYPDLPEPVTVPTDSDFHTEVDNYDENGHHKVGFLRGANFVLATLNLKK